MAESYFGTHLWKLTTCLCWSLFQKRSVVTLDRFHCTIFFLKWEETPQKS